MGILSTLYIKLYSFIDYPGIFIKLRKTATFKRRKRIGKADNAGVLNSPSLFSCREIKVALVATPTQRRQGERFAWATAAKLRASTSRGTPESRAASVTTLLRRL